MKLNIVKGICYKTKKNTFGYVYQRVEVRSVILHHPVFSCGDMFQATVITRRMHTRYTSGVREAQLKAHV